MGLEISGYCIQGFCFKPTPLYPINVQWLSVAGGGGGGGGYATGAGGGGAGQVTIGTASCITSSNVFRVVVGAGGIGQKHVTQQTATNGSNTCILEITSSISGGGGRGGGTNGNPVASGEPSCTGHASGGGGVGTAGPGNDPDFYNGKPGVPGRGYPGGNTNLLGLGFGSGGGGYCSAGCDSSPTHAGNGGLGITWSLTGCAYAGGGGGGACNTSYVCGRGGCGVGGNGGWSGPSCICPTSPTFRGQPGKAGHGGGGGGGTYDAGWPSPTANYANSYGGCGGSGGVVFVYPGPQRAIGGSVSTYCGNTVHHFCSSGNLCFLTDFILNPEYPVPVNYLLVAGGGGGGQPYSSGGGGAGGLIYCTGYTVNTSATYCIVIGAGGAVDTKGGNSVISVGGGTSANLFIAEGGGKGSAGSPLTRGGNGGSGGGGNDLGIGFGRVGQGSNGGAKVSTPGRDGFGGGGGASQAGFDGYYPTDTNALSQTGFLITSGRGGNGCQISINGTATWYAGGGGGGAYVGPGVGGGAGAVSCGGLGGGGCGAGCLVAATPGLANFGGGGGAGSQYDGSPSANGTSGPGKAGGSGIFVLSYCGPQIAVGGTVTSYGGCTIHSFCSSGNLVFCSGYIT